MCWKCDHPDASIQDWLEVIRKTVQKHGWAVQFVESENTPYAYTVGLHEHGLPELLVTGLSPQPAARMLNSVAEYLFAGGRPDAHMNVAVAFYGPALQALQLVWPDDLGHRPWCVEFTAGQFRQPVLGVRVDQPDDRIRDRR